MHKKCWLNFKFYSQNLFNPKYFLFIFVQFFQLNYVNSSAALNAMKRGIKFTKIKKKNLINKIFFFSVILNLVIEA